MSILLITDTYYPINNSGSLQLQDLVMNLKKKEVDVITFTISKKYCETKFNKNRVIYIRVPFYRSNSYILRFFSELLYSFFFYRKIKQFIKKSNIKIDGLIVYSPSIFFGPLIYLLKKFYDNPKTFLILRDIFPEWSVDLNIIKNKYLIKFLKFFSSILYSNSDVIGVQTKSIIKKYHYLFHNKNKDKLILFNNWLTKKQIIKSNLLEDVDFSKKIFIYSGNMGISQNLDLFLDAFKLIKNNDIFLILLGNGKYYKKLAFRIKNEKINNVKIYPSIHDKYLPYFFSKCYAGIISLDYKHKIDNIPGKLLSYLSNGLPVIGSVNKSNDLVSLNSIFKFGYIDDKNSVKNLLDYIIKISDDINSYKVFKKNSFQVYKKFFETDSASTKIKNYFY